ncbi:hypothetical protein CSOJ01_14964, partial [Colletotrichum sojae]
GNTYGNGRSNTRGGNRGQPRGRGRQNRRRPEYPAWFWRWIQYDYANLFSYGSPPREIFDEDLSELSSNADSEKRGHKYDDWECDCASDDSDCNCSIPCSDDESDEELGGFFHDDDLDYQFKQAKASRDKHKRQMRKNRRRDEAATMSAEDKEKAYDEVRRDLLLEIEGAIRDINAAATSADREVSNKILRECSYRLVPAAKLRNEHLAMTAFNSTLRLNISDVSEHRKPSGTEVLELMGHMTVNGKVAMSSGTSSFLGPDRTGKMVFTTEDGQPGAVVQFHDRDYIEKPPLTLYHGPGGYFAFSGVRCTPARERAEAAEMKRLYVESEMSEPSSPQSPKESWFEMNHRMGAYYDSRYSEYF